MQPWEEFRLPSHERVKKGLGELLEQGLQYEERTTTALVRVLGDDGEYVP